jgi:hypothetical protein
LQDHELDPTSESLVATIASWGAHNMNGINTTSYSSPIYTVPAGQPTVKVVLDWGTPPLNAALQSVPVPPHAIVSPGSDEHMVIYQPSSDQMWEFWHMRESLLPPTVASFSAAVTPGGGSLAAGSYYYRVTALSEDGETTPSEAFRVVVPESGSSVTLSFKGVIYGHAYSVYRGADSSTGGSLGTLHQSTNTYGAVVSYTDTGAVSPGANPPTTNTAATPGQWHAGWGGRIANTSSDPGYYRLVHPSGGVLEEPNWGSTASSLPIADGMITIGDLEQGHIDHAMQLLVPTARAGVHAYPAQRTDGGETTPTSIPEGAHFVLNKSFDCGREVTPLMRMVCVAAQNYGFIVNDQTGGGLALRGEDPAPLTQASQPDPYPAFYTDSAGKQWRPYQMMAAFPWAQLQLLSMRLEAQNQYHS